MKRYYSLIGLLLLSSISFAQTDLVVISGQNVASGSSSTGNAASVSSVGLTRGAGVNRATTFNANHTSDSWSASDYAGADAANEYVEWSITAQPTFTIDLDELSLRIQRNTDGPQTYQIYYSLDSDPFTPLSGEQTLTGTGFVIDSYTGLGITSNQGGTITFRLYAWNANDESGWFRFQKYTPFNGLGITDACAKLVGETTAGSGNSSQSDVIESATASYAEDIPYITFDATSGLTPANAQQIGEFTIRDGGATAPDADSDPTTLTEITFNVSNSAYIAAIAIYEGGVLMEEVTSISDVTSFNNLNGGSGIEAPDDGEKTFEVYATFTANVDDGGQFQLTVSSVSAPASGSSLFEFTNGGGAATSVAGQDNTINVTASTFFYLQNTTDVNLFEPMSPAVQLVVVDGNSNLDVDYSDDVTMITSGTFDPEATTTVSAENGVVTFFNLRFFSSGINITISATAQNFINTPSNPFTVGDPFFTIAVQDFDGSGPEWDYNNNPTFFDDTWQVGGFYGVRDVSTSAPIDFPLFSNNILADNQVNQDGFTNYAQLDFEDVDVSGFSNVKIVFDWQVVGYADNRSDLRYNVILNEGSPEGYVFVFDGCNICENDGSGRVVIDIPEGTNKVGLLIEVRNDFLTGYSGVDNVRLVSEFDGLIYRNGTWIPSAPSASTDAEDAIISSGTYTVNAPIDINNMIIDPGTAVEIDPGQTMRTFGTLTNNGSLVLNSTSTQFSSVLPTSVDDNGGSNTYNRFVNVVGSGAPGTGGNDLISLPLIPDSGQTFNEFIALGTTNNASKLATNGSVYAFGPFNTATSAYTNYSVTGTAALNRGYGYRAATITGESLTFSGNIVTGDVTGIPVSKPVGGTQWNLVGNPYPSYIEPLAFLTTNNAVLDQNAVAIYGYNSGTNSGSGTRDNFTVINEVTNSGIKIAPGQGFFIAVDNTEGFSGSIDFTSSMRTLEGNNDFILSRNTAIENPNFRLGLSAGNNTRVTDIYFHENGSLGLDPGYDAATFGSDLRNFELYTHLVAENEGRSMMVQTVGLDDINDVRIPLGVNASQGQQLTFSVHYSNLSNDIEVIIEDTESNTLTRLNTGDYVMTATTNISGTGRFYLNFSSNLLSNPEQSLSDLQVYGGPNKQIHINGSLNSDTKIMVYDIQGRLVLNTDLNTSQNQRQIDASSLNQGVYVVQLNNESGSISIKTILK